ncbi:hypothetical protein PHAVU_001G106200 [Phaseolus vulgaris]|uniref:Transmembrane protein n=1 Tax=Phaseolus vulgaris TaxID=3885 RepID=V7CX74_PHAVU|nr:hypothetical protein PHAVU_001G106200g [Phaseolus vulgaris]ESW33885.1 hypothetical protein PHAVU_001G106200g [Phaseolus vulgaris]
MQRNLMNLLLLLIIFLHFTYLLSASHLPLTRTRNLKVDEEEFSAMSSFRLEHGLGNGDEVVGDMKEGELIERRVYLETQDYEGTGANRDHDPKSPGGV